MDDPDVKLLLAILLLVALAGAGWFFRDELLPGPEVQAPSHPAPATVDERVNEGPKYPVLPFETAESGAATLVPLPPLDDSDGYFILALMDVFGSAIEPLLAKEAIIDRLVGTIDGLPRDHVAEKIRPVGRLSNSFTVVTDESNGPIFLSQENFKRYDFLVNQIRSADIDTVVATYRRFYPLLQQSYERLGYPDAYFNDRVVEVIDHLLRTPQPDEPIRLVRPHVLYEFADPELEALSSGRKLLLRMGGEHAAVMKSFLGELRAEIAVAD